MEKTELLFRQDVDMQECDSHIIEIIEEENAAEIKKGSGSLIVLDRTVFFPEGGGQSCDLGFIADAAGSGNQVEITDVFEKEGIVYHRVPSHGALKKGDTVHCVLDRKRRFDNMQRHCGEHILSGIFFREYGGVNRGFHMGEDYMTIDISLEEKPEFTEITWDMAKHAELCANEVIWADAPVITRHFDTFEEAAHLPLRKKLSIQSDITIVCVGDVKNPSDCVACCGTHPKTAGHVGLIKIFRVEKYKGMFRIFCEAGRRAYLDYEKKHDIVSRLGAKYSAGSDDLEDKIKTQQDKLHTAKDELYHLKQSVIAQRVTEIEAALAASDGKSPVVFEYSDMGVDDLLQLGRPLTDKIKKLLLVIAARENVLLLFSNGKTADCGKLVKENASIYNGKGGGNAAAARALFPSREGLDTFIDLLEKHLR
ncbi:MAG: alanyl-tRNA editing protein [Clostridia bacterium]|nr:alanyl-tRNA editing protein [Clostridia bacterium]